MKTKWIFLLILGIFFLGACKRVYLPNPVVDNGQQISMKSSASINAESDTTKVERGVMVNFQAVSNGPKIISWQWTFEDDSSQLFGQEVSHAFWSQPPTIIKVKLLGIDAGNNQYHTSAYFKVVWSLDGLPAVKWISSTIIPNSTNYHVVLAFNKAGMRYSGNQYFYIGSMTTWKTKLIPVADSNYLIINDSLIDPSPGNMGKYVAVRLTITPGAYKIGVGKIVKGKQMWGQFYDSTMIKFSLSNAGVLTLNSDSIPAIMPGTVGDSILRFDFYQKDSVLVIYTNNEQKFININPFIYIQDKNGAFVVRFAEDSVPGFSTWGKVSGRLSSLLDNNILVMRFGPELGKPNVFSNNMPYSEYWDNYWRVLKAMFSINSLKESGGQNWAMVPVK